MLYRRERILSGSLRNSLTFAINSSWKSLFPAILAPVDITGTKEKYVSISHFLRHHDMQGLHGYSGDGNSDYGNAKSEADSKSDVLCVSVVMAL